MAELIPEPTVLWASGAPPKTISEFVGRLASGTASVSVGVMDSPPGWSEPGQRPVFDEYSVVLEGQLVVEDDQGTKAVPPGSAVHAAGGEWVRYSTPEGARYVSVCVPAFSPETVNRETVNRDT
ncbi:MAG: cupin domain-containing protein [Acidimicrobiales bacterium]